MHSAFPLLSIHKHTQHAVMRSLEQSGFYLIACFVVVVVVVVVVVRSFVYLCVCLFALLCLALLLCFACFESVS